MERGVWDLTKISVIVPCYNAEKDLPVLAKELQEMVWDLEEDFEFEVILVNDGSLDGTYVEMGKFDVVGALIHVVSYSKNGGLGFALRKGFEKATGDYLFVLDSDASYSPRMLKKMVNALEKNKCDIVTVSPYMKGGAVVGVPAHRLILSKGVNFLYRLASGLQIHTFTAMVRLYKSNIKNIEFKNNGFLSQSELLLKAYFEGFTVMEIPAELKIEPTRKSSMKVVKTILTHLKFLFWVVRRRISERF